MKATEQYFPVVLFIMLYKVVLTFGSVDEILKCDHSNEHRDKVLLSSFILVLVFGIRNFRNIYGSFSGIGPTDISHAGGGG